MSVEETSLIEVEGVLQIDLLHVSVGRSADTDNVKGVAVQVERMRQIWLLYCKRRTSNRNVNNV